MHEPFISVRVLSRRHLNSHCTPPTPPLEVRPQGRQRNIATTTTAAMHSVTGRPRSRPRRCRHPGSRHPARPPPSISPRHCHCSRAGAWAGALRTRIRTRLHPRALRNTVFPVQHGCDCCTTSRRRTSSSPTRRSGSASSENVEASTAHGRSPLQAAPVQGLEINMRRVDPELPWPSAPRGLRLQGPRTRRRGKLDVQRGRHNQSVLPVRSFEKPGRRQTAGAAGPGPDAPQAPRAQEQQGSAIAPRSRVRGPCGVGRRTGRAWPRGRGRR